ncbi:MAG: hypothetical protein WBC51_10155 [Vicinamibacterales bacterium]
MFGLTRRELAGLVALFLATLPVVTPRIYSSDEVQYFSYLRSLWFDRDVSFDNEYRYFYEHGVARTQGFEDTFLQLTTPAGRRVNFATLGCAVLWAPFYAVADVWTRMARARGSEMEADGFSQPYVAAVAYGSACYGFLAVLLSIGAARRVTGYGIAPGLAVWVGSPLLFYMYVAPGYSHACSAFAVALFVSIWLHVRRTWSHGGVAALAASAALMTIVREQDAFLALGPALDYLLPGSNRVLSDRGLASHAQRLAIAGVAFVLCALPQLLAYKAVNGHFSPSRLVSRKMTWTAPHGLQVLLSPEHGFFFWTPLAFLAVVGVILLALRGVPYHIDARRIGVCAVVMIAAQVYVSGSVESWTVAGAFGQRRFVALTVLLTMGMAAIWSRANWQPGWFRYALAGCVAVAIWWNVALIALFGTGLMDRQRLELGRNAYDVFVTLPTMAPQLAYRYFTNRRSFYKPPEIP